MQEIFINSPNVHLTFKTSCDVFCLTILQMIKLAMITKFRFSFFSFFFNVYINHFRVLLFAVIFIATGLFSVLTQGSIIFISDCQVVRDILTQNIFFQLVGGVPHTFDVNIFYS